MLENKPFQNVRFINLFDGHFAVTASHNEEGAVRRINKNNVEVWEYLYNSLSGRVTEILTHENEYGKSWRVTLQDGPEKYILTLPYASRYSKGFVYRIGNADLAKDIELKVGKFQKDGREIAFLTIYQDGKKVEPMWTKESPGELPPMEKVRVRGQEVWDDSEQLLFLERFIGKVILPRLTQEEPASDDLPRRTIPPATEEEALNDLPF